MDEKLYIPIGVKPEGEFFRGFSKKQMIQAVIGSLCGGVLDCILWQDLSAFRKTGNGISYEED